jgi:hypothetical protein
MLTFDSLVIAALPLVASLENPVAVPNHMLIQSVAIVGIDQISENDHSILVETFQCHLKIRDGVFASLQVRFRQRYAARSIGVGCSARCTVYRGC